MKKTFVSFLLTTALLAACPCEDHQLLMVGETYHGDSRYALFLDKTSYTYFVLSVDEDINPYELIKEQEILEFKDALDLFPNLKGLEYCYGLDC